jgi:hypothetical protein
MALTDDQARQLAELQAQRDAPEPRTETGVAGVLHTLIDVVSGTVPHLAGDAWQALHKQAEALAGAAITGAVHGVFGTETEPGTGAGGAAGQAPGTETEPGT